MPDYDIKATVNASSPASAIEIQIRLVLHPIALPFLLSLALLAEYVVRMLSKTSSACIAAVLRHILR